MIIIPVLLVAFLVWVLIADLGGVKPPESFSGPPSGCFTAVAVGVVLFVAAVFIPLGIAEVQASLAASPELRASLPGDILFIAVGLVGIVVSFIMVKIGSR